MTRVRMWSPGQAVCRVLVVVLPVLALLVSGVDPGPMVIVLVVAGSLAWAVLPESVVGAAVLVAVLGWWALAVPDPLRPGLLVAALALAGAHSAGLLAAYAPDRAALDRALVVMWVRRTLLSFVAAPVAYAAVVLLDRPEAAIWPAGLGLLTMLLLLTVLRLREVSGPSAI